MGEDIPKFIPAPASGTASLAQAGAQCHKVRRLPPWPPASAGDTERTGGGAGSGKPLISPNRSIACRAAPAVSAAIFATASCSPMTPRASLPALSRPLRQWHHGREPARPGRGGGVRLVGWVERSDTHLPKLVMRRRPVHGGGLAGGLFGLRDALGEAFDLPLQPLDQLPLRRDGCVQILNRLVLMDHTHFKLVEAARSVGYVCHGVPVCVRVRRFPQQAQVVGIAPHNPP